LVCLKEKALPNQKIVVSFLPLLKPIVERTYNFITAVITPSTC